MRSTKLLNEASSKLNVPKFFIGIFLLSLVLFIGKSDAAIKSESTDSARSVRIVCLAEDASKFAKNLPLLWTLAGIADMAGVREFNIGEFAKLLKTKYPPVGRWNFLPIGSGFVVHTGKDPEGAEKSWVVTNWHVASACPLTRLKLNKNKYELERTGLSLGILEPVDNEIRPILADLYSYKTERDKNGALNQVPYNVKALCKNPQKPCNAFTPPFRQYESDEETKLVNNVKFYAPDIAVLRLREKTKIAPIPIQVDEKINSKSRLEIQGFPQVALQTQEDGDGKRSELATPVLASATYSSTQTFTNERPGVQLDEVVRTDLMFLAAQVHPGHSGGPLLNEGNVVGVVTSTIVLGNLKMFKSGNLDDGNEHTSSDKSIIPAGYALAVPASDIVKVLNFFEVPYLKASQIAKPNEQTSSVPVASVKHATPTVEPKWWQATTNQVTLLLLALLSIIAVFVGVTIWRKNQEEASYDSVDPYVEEHQENHKTGVHNEPNKATNNTTSKATPYVRLRASLGPLDGHFPLPAPNGSPTLFVGRDPSTCQIVFPNNQTNVSQLHCSIAWNEQSKTLIVKDFSTHGTFVNGEKLEKSVNRILKNGDTIAIADKNANQFTVEML